MHLLLTHSVDSRISSWMDKHSYCWAVQVAAQEGCKTAEVSTILLTTSGNQIYYQNQWIRNTFFYLPVFLSEKHHVKVGRGVCLAIYWKQAVFKPKYTSLYQKNIYIKNPWYKRYFACDPALLMLSFMNIPNIQKILPHFHSIFPITNGQNFLDIQ